MKSPNFLRASACMTLAAMLGILATTAAPARTWTIHQRQVAEQSRITKGEKSGELTKKEADGLRADMADIDSKIAKAKAKNGGKISIKDQGKIEKDLNDVTLKIEKLELAKRTQPK
ncbi:MAG TPA: hypothetical protein V6C69_20900 [Trichormus sp.]